MRRIFTSIFLFLVLFCLIACATETKPAPVESTSNNSVSYKLPTVHTGGDCARASGEHPQLTTILSATDAMFIGKVADVRQSVTPFVAYSDEVQSAEDCGYIEPALELEFEEVRVLAGTIDSQPLRIKIKPGDLESWSSSIRSTGFESHDFEWTNAEERITAGIWLGGMLREVPNTGVHILIGAFVAIHSDGTIDWLEDGECTSTPAEFADAKTLDEFVNAIPERLPVGDAAPLDERWISATCFTPYPDNRDQLP